MTVDNSKTLMYQGDVLVYEADDHFRNRDCNEAVRAFET